MVDQLKHHNEQALLALLQQFSTHKVSERSVQLAQRTFYDCLVRELDQHAMLIVSHNKELAQVAMQEAWLKIFTSADKFNPALSSVKTWAKMITSQCAMDELRRFYKHDMRTKDRKSAPNDIDGSQEDLLDNVPCPLPSMEERQHAQQVQKAIAFCIDNLPSGDGPNYKLAMKLVLDEEMTYQQMCDVLSLQSSRHAKLNAEQVRGWVRQAAAKMKACINQKLGRPGETR